MGFRRHGCTHEQGSRPCGTGNAAELEAARLLQIGVEPPEVARRLKVSRTSVRRWKQAFEANGRSDRGKRSRRGGALRKAPRYLAPAAADRRREEAIGRNARSRRLGARICHRSVDAGARGQAHREDQLQAVFGIGCVRSLRGARWRRRFLRKATLLSLPKDGGADAAFDKPEGNVPEGDARYRRELGCGLRQPRRVARPWTAEQLACRHQQSRGIRSARHRNEHTISRRQEAGSLHAKEERE